MEYSDITYTVIRYFVMLGKRFSPNPIAVLPPFSTENSLINYLFSFPHNLHHYLEGCDYFQRVLLSGFQSGLQVYFVFNDSIEEPSFSTMISNGLNVFLICTDNDEDLMEMNISLSRVCANNCLFWINASKKEKFLMPKVITTANEFWSFLFKYSQPLIDKVNSPLCVPICGGDIEFPYFKPANITYFTLESALGNWGVGTLNDSQNELNNIIKKTKESLDNLQSSMRQDKMVDIATQLFGLCKNAYQTMPTKDFGFSDQNYPPLIISAPFTSKDVRDIFKKIAHWEDHSFQDVDVLIEIEQTPNYCFDLNTEKIKIDTERLNTLIRLFQSNRLGFIDFAASLHCSFRFSPYLRLPLISKSVNTELSFVSAKNNYKLTYSKDRLAYDKAIHKVGQLLSTKLLFPKACQMLETIPSQIVALTDLPIEWMEINGVPLGFSHDVCRIPETPASGMLTHYGIGRYSAYYKIPYDILNKTLVIYGCREGAFKEWQEKADAVASILGAKTMICQSLKEFDVAVKQYKPDFLIIDTHGGTDLVNHQSYIYMGNEKVYPNDIANHNISAPLIFISACNTAPCYNDVNTIANAFLEVGACAVTSSYLPLDVDESSMLYIRIMNQLSVACKQNIHRNWLAFISHMLRTSFIMTPLVASAIDKESQSINPLSVGRINTLSMVFKNRSKLYRDLKNNNEIEGVKYDFTAVIPHYLMYTTIGRADLVEFDVAAKKRVEIFDDLMNGS